MFWKGHCYGTRALRNRGHSIRVGKSTKPCLHIVGDLVQSHSIHFDCSSPLLLLEVNVAHVHPKASTKGILLVLDDLCVNRQGLIVLGGREATLEEKHENGN